MTELKLRDYQRQAIDAINDAWHSGMQSPAVVLPTGMGKTVVFSHLTSEFVGSRNQRVVILVHRDELADQAINKIRSVAPHLYVGKIKAESNETDAQVLVCSVQTLANPKRLDQINRNVGLVIVDECHHAAAKTYQTILQALVWSKNVAEAVCVGFTATLARGDGVGLGETWNDVVFSRSVMYAISRGYLTDVRAKAVEVGLDFKGVKKTGGDFQSGDLGRALEDSDMEDVLPRAYREYASDRPGVVFTPTVATAHGIAESFNAAGIRTAVISGETPREERQRIYSDYRTGRIQVLSNCMVLTEGFDAPWASCAVIARPTQSEPLYIQMVGRVLRPWPGKKDALVLDVVGVNGKLRSLMDLAPGEVESVRDDESLEEAAVRENEEENDGRSFQRLTDLARNIRARDIELFSGSSQSWLITKAGVMFIPVGDGDVFLWARDAETWDVCYAPKSGKWERIRTSLTLGMAQAWAEAEAEERMPFNTGRSASWRKKKASEAQVRLARNLGHDVSQNARSGEVGDLISVSFASKKFDRYVGRV